jgi:transposase-like protein
MRVLNRKYDDDFKRNTVKKVLNGQPVSSVSRELGNGE